MKRALITGITGQDGSYLAELLLSKGYEVHGLIRRRRRSTRRGSITSTRIHTKRMHDYSCTTAISPTAPVWSHCCSTIEPDEVYNLAAQSHVRVSFDEPVHTGDTTGMGTTTILEAIRHSRAATAAFTRRPRPRCSAPSPPPQNEQTPFWPRARMVRQRSTGTG